MTSALKYRPDIDGLRAIAVLAVVLFHFNLGIPGGFIGVDVFFVISGYLITSLILRDLRNGTFSLAEFWDRRIRRIMPALAVMSTIVLVVGSFVLLPHDLEFLGQTVIAQALLVSNMLFWKTTGYFGATADQIPMLHTWSLSVEEQYYLFFPGLLFLIWRFGGARRKALVVAALVLGFISSLALAAALIPSKPQTVFYWLPTRAWELLTGSLLATAPPSEFLRKNGALRSMIAWCSLMAIVLPMFLYNSFTPFPGLAALPPCLGTAGLIYVNTLMGADEKGILRRVLTSAPMVGTGLISYSLYLWHWPVFVYSHYWATSELPLGINLLLVGLSLILAFLSWKFVETPLRKKGRLSRRGTFAFAALTTSVLVSAGSFFWLSNGAPMRLNETTQRLVFNKDHMTDLQNRRTRESDIRADNLTPLGSENVPPTFLLWGDSHAQMLIPAFDGAARKLGISGRAFWAAGTAPLAGVYIQRPFALNEKSIAVARDMVDFVREKRIKMVFLEAFWASYQETHGKELKAGLIQLVKELTEAGAKVCIVGDIPVHSKSAIKLMLRNAFFQRDEKIEATDVGQHRERNSIVYELADEIPGVYFLDLSPVFLTADSESYGLAENGRLLYRDADHISADAAVNVIEPFLEAELPKLLSR